MPIQVVIAVVTGGNGSTLGTTNTNWTTIHSDANAASVDTASTTDNPRTNKSGANYDITRYFVAFDTSVLPPNAVINSATFDFTTAGTAVIGNADTTTIEICPGTQTTPPSAIGVADYSKVSLTSYGNIAISSLSNSTLYHIALNAAGIAFLNKNGYTKLCAITGVDLVGSPAPTGVDEVSICTPVNATPSNRPTLTIDYTADSGYAYFM